MVIRGKSVQTLAYLAGLIDGEGHIGIDKTKGMIQRRINPRYQAELVIVNSDDLMIQWLKETFGGAVYARKKQKDFHKQTWRWKVGDLNAAAICEEVLPYLISKREQAKSLIEFVRDMPPKPRGLGAMVSAEEIERREHYYQHIKKLNDYRHPQRLTEETAKADVIV